MWEFALAAFRLRVLTLSLPEETGSWILQLNLPPGAPLPPGQSLRITRSSVSLSPLLLAAALAVLAIGHVAGFDPLHGPNQCRPEDSCQA